MFVFVLVQLIIMSRRLRTDFRVSPEVMEEKKHLNMLIQAARAVERDVDRLVEENNLQKGKIKELERSMGGGGGESKTSQVQVAESDDEPDWNNRFQSRFRMASGTPQILPGDGELDYPESEVDAPPQDSRFRQASGLPMEPMEPIDDY